MIVERKGESIEEKKITKISIISKPSICSTPNAYEEFTLNSRQPILNLSHFIFCDWPRQEHSNNLPFRPRFSWYARSDHGPTAKATRKNTLLPEIMRIMF